MLQLQAVEPDLLLNTQRFFSLLWTEDFLYQKDYNMNILYETNNLRLENEYETTFLIKTLTGERLMEDDFYGDPKCGLIDKNGNWAIVAGEHLTIWTEARTQRIESEELKWIHSLRNKDSETVEILTDPWSENSAIWEINTKTFELKKVKGFANYKDKGYSDRVIW
jgi:hypothetical protein